MASWLTSTTAIKCYLWSHCNLKVTVTPFAKAQGEGDVVGVPLTYYLLGYWRLIMEPTH